jgi:hypothetical protein
VYSSLSFLRAKTEHLGIAGIAVSQTESLKAFADLQGIAKGIAQSA